MVTELYQAETVQDEQTVGRNFLGQTVKAHGGAAFLNCFPLKFVGNGEFYMPPQLGRLKFHLDSFTLYLAPDGRSRLEAASAFGRIRIVFCGRKEGGFAVLGGRRMAFSADHFVGVDPLHLLRVAFLDNYPARAVTEEGQLPRACDVQSKNVATSRITVDPLTHLMRRLDTKSVRGDMTVLLDAYQSVAEVNLPGTIRLFEDGVDMFNLTTQEITTNCILEDSLFQMQ